MFEKIEVKDKHLFLTPNKFDKKLPLLIMSHGSGGISDIDIDFAMIACGRDYQVAIIDHFTHRNVKHQIWNDLDNFHPNFEDRVQDIIEISNLYNTDRKLLFGVSAGGTSVIKTSSKFEKTFCVYPALASITEDMLAGKNITIVTGKDDDWTPVEQAFNFQKHVECDLITLPGYHAFLNPRENRYLPDVISLRNVSLPVPHNGNITNISYEKGVTLQYNPYSRKDTESLFWDWLS